MDGSIQDLTTILELKEKQQMLENYQKEIKKRGASTDNNQANNIQGGMALGNMEQAISFKKRFNPLIDRAVTVTWCTTAKQQQKICPTGSHSPKTEDSRSKSLLQQLLMHLLQSEPRLLFIISVL